MLVCVWRPGADFANDRASHMLAICESAKCVCPGHPGGGANGRHSVPLKQLAVQSGPGWRKSELSRIRYRLTSCQSLA